MSNPLVLVTGGTGLLGSHVIQQLLAAGYRVRATVRPGKITVIEQMFPGAFLSGDVQALEVPSLTSDYTEALKNVWAVIHCASPIFSRGYVGKELFDGTYNGSTHLVNAAVASGIKKIVVTGTYASLFGADFKEVFGTVPLNSSSFGAVEWSDVNLETDSPANIYQRGKTLAEKKIWEMAHANPDVDISVVLPPPIYGPWVAGYPAPKDRTALGTDNFVYSLIAGGSKGPRTYPDSVLGHMVDVRDVAKAHILALDVPQLKDGRDKRFIVNSHIYDWPEIVAAVRRRRPELGDRLPAENAIPPTMANVPLDLSLTEQILGLKEYIPWEQTILDTIEELVRWEQIRE